MLETIHNDHRNINQLLRILRKKINLLENDEKVDFRLVKAMINYLRNYADKYHHPMEDLIYAYYLKYRVVPDEVANRLAREHKKIKEVTIALDELVEMVLLDAIVPKDQLIEKLSEFVEMQAVHLMYEESQILPDIKNSLSADDWLNLEQQWQHNHYDDPLFGDNISEEYKSLAERINQHQA
ncbi:hemerythrin [Psychromonas sp. psych-6C06]|uniref:hemerythrin domain-containing protein n=1 Tax=Psychromonas sp. psych-6C06 TaxID=2058089 RepID=UPI000C3252D9|nr:hemerythrin domain-containing protein [Psychromonas sp. psych-6C06]PKF62650.1 hemerythrin [Psychromonas sp. psych-6C06]